jgi:hypothetical protein
MRKPALLALTALGFAGLAMPAPANAYTYCGHRLGDGKYDLKVLRTSCAMGRSVARRWSGGGGSRQYVAPFTCFYHGGLYGGSIACRGSLGRWVWFGWGD